VGYVCIQDTGTPAPDITDTDYWAAEGDPPPEKYDVYAFGEVDKLVKPFRITDMTVTQDQKCTLTLIEYREEIYTFEEIDPSVNPSVPDPIMVLPPSGLTVTEYAYVENDIVYASAIVSWQKSADPRVFRYTVGINGGDYNFKWITASNFQAAEIRPIKPGTYTFYVRCVTENAGASTWAQVTKTIFGNIASPPDVESLDISVTQTALTLSWKAVAGAVGYRIKFSPAMSGATWWDATEIGYSTGTNIQGQPGEQKRQGSHYQLHRTVVDERGGNPGAGAGVCGHQRRRDYR